MNGVLPYILLVAVMFLGFGALLYMQFRNEQKKRQWELQKDTKKVISPIRLRAYERLALLLERTKPEHMLLDLRSKEPEALDSWAVGQLQQYLLQTIRLEFDHNQSQQVYVSDEIWDAIMGTRDQLAAFIISIAAQIPKDATAQVYASALITAFNSNGVTSTDKALSMLKDEAKDLM